jgi:hypothetical protein
MDTIVYPKNKTITKKWAVLAMALPILFCFSAHGQGPVAPANYAYAALKQKNAVLKASAADNTAVFDPECRPPHDDEAAVIENAQKVINKCVTEQLLKIGWTAKYASTIPPSIASNPNPYRPLFICSSVFDLIISPDPGSDYGKMISDSIRYYSTQTTMAAMIRMSLLQALQNIKIRIAENGPYIKIPFEHNPTDKYTVMHVPGTGYAYRLTLPEQGSDAGLPPDYKTFLLIGAWAGADMNAATYVKYPFVHKQGGAYIETLVVQIIGPASIADKVIQNVDWQGLSAALAK